MIGYHFTGDKLRNGGPIPTVGVWLEHTGPVAPCESGLHASEHPFDALTYAPGEMLHRVELEGDLMAHGDPTDKWVGRRRRILASIDATAILREFARWCALQVIDLWDAPPVVREFLTTGDESLGAAAGAAAWDVGADAAQDAAGDAAWTAAWTAWDARDTARDATYDAVCAAARDAAAGPSAQDAAGAAQRQCFAEMARRAFEKETGQ